jgi:cytochrome bd-type quinol oxidase subunit 2
MSAGEPVPVKKARPRVPPAAVYVALAVILGFVTGTLQGFGSNTAQWIGACIAPPLIGAIFGVVVRILRKKNEIARWMFWWSAVTVILAILERLRAP